MRSEYAWAKSFWLEGLLSNRYRGQFEQHQNLRDDFCSKGYVKLPEFLAPAAFHALAAEVNRIHENRIRKDFVMPGFNTDRKMSVRSGRDVIRQSELIARLYACKELRHWIRALIGSDIHTVRHGDEFLVINFLDGERDTHGWHLDDPRYAFIIVLESPAPPVGGQIEYVPQWKLQAREWGFDPYIDVEGGVEICRGQGLLRSDTLIAGDCYLIDAGEVLHRVTPMSAEGKRKALNLAFDDRCYRVYGESAKRLYA